MIIDQCKLAGRTVGLVTVIWLGSKLFQFSGIRERGRIYYVRSCKIQSSSFVLLTLSLFNCKKTREIVDHKLFAFRRWFRKYLLMVVM